MLTLDCRGKRILFISDLHFPYAHPDWYAFLKAIKEKYLDFQTVVINMGDEVDFSAISFHDQPAEGLSPDSELVKALEEIQRLKELFPFQKILESNHGSLIFRKIKYHKLPLRILKPMNELYNTPDWEWHESIRIKTDAPIDVYCRHRAKPRSLFKQVNMSGVQAHNHTIMEISWACSALEEKFNMHVGSLIDYFRLVFQYGKENVPEPVLGCGMLDSDGVPHLLKMKLDENRRWTGEV